MTADIQPGGSLIELTEQAFGEVDIYAPDWSDNRKLVGEMSGDVLASQAFSAISSALGFGILGVALTLR